LFAPKSGGEVQIRRGKTSAAKSLIAGRFWFVRWRLLLLVAVYGLSMVLAPWLAALAVGAFLLVIAVILISVGQGRLRLVKKPEKTIRTMKEDVQWLRDQTR
jgi:uncharacterized membrane protein